MLGSSRNWQTAGADLAANFHVHAVDLRNHGQSPHAAGMSYTEMMEDVLAWLAGQGLSTATILGHSMGGKVAMLLACRRPEVVERLIVVDIAPKDYFWVGHRASFAAMNELSLTDLRSRAEAEMRFEARVPNWAMRKFLTTNLERTEAGTWKWQINLPVLTQSLAGLESNPLSADDRYTGRTLFLAGGKSEYVLAEDEPGLRRHFPAAQVQRIAASGHNPHMETRAEFVAAVVAWAVGGAA